MLWRKINRNSVKTIDYRNYFVAVSFVVLTTFVGVHILTQSQAAGPYANAEASNGSLTGSTTLESNGNSSNGNYVQFGSASSTGSGSNPSGEIGSPTTVDGPTCSDPIPVAPVAGYTSVTCQDFIDGLSNGGFGDFGPYDGGGSGTVVGIGREPSQCSVSGGYLHLVQSSNGATCGGWMNSFGQQYGLWEVRMRAYTTGNGSGSEPHPVLILWPEQGGWTSELDWFETDIGSQAGGYLHCTNSDGSANQNCFVLPSNSINYSQWHVYSIVWTSTSMSGYIDGQLWWSSDNTSSFQPLGSSNLTLQLDNLSGSTPVDPGEMDINWAHMFKQ